jgi:hypothetical protein
VAPLAGLYINDSLLLRVDQQTANYGHATNGGLKVAHTNSSLYIGGLPGTNLSQYEIIKKSPK